MKTKKEIALEIFSLLEDEDLINWSARETPGDSRDDVLNVINVILANYLIIDGYSID